MFHLRFSLKTVAALAAALVVCGAFSARAQDQRRHKVPGLDKITNGPTEAIFRGKVQSLNLKDKDLNVESVEGQDTEIFPITKKTRVQTAEGGKLKLDSLTSGADVMVYYEQKGDRRQVKRVEVLEPGTVGARKKSPPS